jgi:hypothetical protein
MDPAISGIAHSRPMTQDTSGSGGAIYDINIRPSLGCRVNISSAQKIVRKVLLHIFLSDTGNGQISAGPDPNVGRESTQGDRQHDGGINNALQAGCQNTISYAGGYQQQNSQNPNEP